MEREGEGERKGKSLERFREEAVRSIVVRRMRVKRSMYSEEREVGLEESRAFVENRCLVFALASSKTGIVLLPSLKSQHR